MHIPMPPGAGGEYDDIAAPEAENQDYNSQQQQQAKEAQYQEYQNQQEYYQQEYNQQEYNQHQEYNHQAYHQVLIYALKDVNVQTAEPLSMQNY